ncbi:general secretion pathway protein GspK [Anaerobaca lacustris]|uniref:Type II secretion system protein GspK n=1 Tax=Anaerobaca lacustris TaxID=3044600 RepID=A0AAW6U4T4_9BACT|nr:type II secretion system protein GspK [Sedimentisphaerales bacterium M17dextr]
MHRQFVGSHRADGTILIVTIWVVLVLAGLALVFARSMRVAAIVSANQVASLEAEWIASGACQYIIAQLVANATDSDALNENAPWEALQVGQGYFWVLRPTLKSNQEFEFGLTDEAGKINLNSASLEMLLKLPGMSSELAASVIDWRDEDGDVTTGGAEDEYYLLLPEPYNCKNAPFETVDEILLVKGASEELLYGEDTNRDGRLTGGFYDYITVYSVEANTDSEGNERINLSDANARATLQSALQEVAKEERVFEILNNIPISPSYASVMDFYFGARLTIEEFEQIADQLTVSDDETLPGLVNVNTAPKEVLLCLPELEEADVEALVSYRQSNNSLDSVAWVAKVLDREKATAIGPHITVRSSQYSADIICLSGNGRAYKRYKAVFDTQAGQPAVVYWKSLTRFGWPLEEDIVATLRKGRPITEARVGMR